MIPKKYSVGFIFNVPAPGTGALRGLGNTPADAVAKQYERRYKAVVNASDLTMINSGNQEESACDVCGQGGAVEMGEGKYCTECYATIASSCAGSREEDQAA